jgi:hypothetical protein
LGLIGISDRKLTDTKINSNGESYEEKFDELRFVTEKTIVGNSI